MGLVDKITSTKPVVFASLFSLSACGGGGSDGGGTTTPSSTPNSQKPQQETQLPQNAIYSLNGTSCVANFFYPLEPNQINDPKMIPIPIKKESLLVKSNISYIDSITNLPEGSYEIQIVCSNIAPQYLRGTVYQDTLDVTKKDGL